MSALYGKYTLDSKSALAVRGELYYDPDGYTAGAAFAKATYKEVTLTYEHRPWHSLMLRLEGGDDFANGDAFLSASSPIPTRRSQPTLLVAAIVTFQCESNTRG